MLEDDVLDMAVDVYAEVFGLVRPEIAEILKADDSEIKEIRKGISPRLVQHIIRLLREDGRDVVRKACAVALRRLDTEKAVEPFFEALGDRSWEVRRSAAYGIGKLERYLTNGRLQRLLNGAADKDWKVREGHCQALGYLKETLRGMGRGGAVVDTLIHRLDDKHPIVRARAAVSLGNIGKVLKLKQAVMTNPLVERLGDPEPVVRAAAVHALGKIKDYLVLESLIPLIGDGDSYVRGAARKAVANASDIGRLFVDALAGRKADLSRLATFAGILEKLAESEHPGTRERARNLLSDIHMDSESRSKYLDSVKRLKIMNSFTTNPGIRIRKKTPS